MSALTQAQQDQLAALRKDLNGWNITQSKAALAIIDAALLGPDVLTRLEAAIAEVKAMAGGTPTPEPVPTPVPVPTPTPTPIAIPVDASTPNRPDGLTTLVDWGGGAKTPGIGEIYVSDETIPSNVAVADNSGPKSPGTLQRFTIPALTQDEYDKAVAGTIDPSTNRPYHMQRGTGFVSAGPGMLSPNDSGKEEVYIARWLRPSANLVGDPAGSKSMMLGISGIGSLYINYETTPEVFMLPIMLAPKAIEPRNDTWLERNRASTPLVRGNWGLWELQTKMNTPGVANGILRGWCNKVLQFEYTDWIYRPAGSNAKFDSLKTDFYQNKAQLFQMSWDMDHWTVAGR